MRKWKECLNGTQLNLMPMSGRLTHKAAGRESSHRPWKLHLSMCRASACEVNCYVHMTSTATLLSSGCFDNSVSKTASVCCLYVVCSRHLHNCRN